MGCPASWFLCVRRVACAQVAHLAEVAQALMGHSSSSLRAAAARFMGKVCRASLGRATDSCARSSSSWLSAAFRCVLFPPLSLNLECVTRGRVCPWNEILLRPDPLRETLSALRRILLIGVPHHSSFSPFPPSL